MDIIQTFSYLFKNKGQQEQFKALMSFLSGSERNVDNLPESFLDALSPKLIALVAVLSWRLAVIKRLNIDTNVIKNIVKHVFIAEYLLSKQTEEDVIAYLDFDISDNEKTTDLFSNEKLQSFYYRAALKGYNGVLTFLEGLARFNPPETARADLLLLYHHAVKRPKSRDIEVSCDHLVRTRFNPPKTAEFDYSRGYYLAAQNGHTNIGPAGDFWPTLEARKKRPHTLLFFYRTEETPPSQQRENAKPARRPN